MQTAPRWAANLAKVMGAIAWGTGVLLHLGLFAFLSAMVAIVVAGGGRGIPFDDWQVILRVLITLFSGPVAVLVGGGLRFLGGLMSGSKVAGDQAPRIMLFEWLRYELFALGTAANLFSIGAFELMTSSILWGTIAFFGLVTFGIGCLFLAARFGKKSGDLMWELRREGIRTGQVPYPADAIAQKNPLGGLPIAAEPIQIQRMSATGKKPAAESVSRNQAP